jgi:hypothetical protein
MADNIEATAINKNASHPYETFSLFCFARTLAR